MRNGDRAHLQERSRSTVRKTAVTQILLQARHEALSRNRSVESVEWLLRSGDKELRRSAWRVGKSKLLARQLGSVFNH